MNLFIQRTVPRGQLILNVLNMILSSSFTGSSARTLGHSAIFSVIVSLNTSKLFTVLCTLCSLIRLCIIYFDISIMTILLIIKWFYTYV